jgi:hypothetical protein
MQVPHVDDSGARLVGATNAGTGTVGCYTAVWLPRDPPIRDFLSPNNDGIEDVLWCSMMLMRDRRVSCVRSDYTYYPSLGFMIGLSVFIYEFMKMRNIQ